LEAVRVSLPNIASLGTSMGLFWTPSLTSCCRFEVIARPTAL
jgi:hypothetical protein